MIVHRSGWICGSRASRRRWPCSRVSAGPSSAGRVSSSSVWRVRGQAWIELAGEVTTYQLAPGEVLLAHPGHIGMFDQSISFTITTVPGIKNKLFGGDGLFLVRLTGPGQVWLQSLALPGLAHSLAPYLPANENNNPSGGRGLGGIVGNILNQQ